MWKVMLLFVVCLCLVGCGDDADSSADQAQAVATAQAMGEAQRQVGMPGITNFQQRRLMKMILEECDREGLVCYAYLQSQLSGQLLYLGRCLGYGVPFSAQFTNPERVAIHRKGGSYSKHLMPQPDPNGLFMPTSSEATWLLMLDEEDKPRVVYCEPGLFVSPFPLADGFAVVGGP